MIELKMSELCGDEGLAFSGTRFLTSVSKQKLISLLSNNRKFIEQYSRFIFGGATGVDTMAGSWCNSTLPDIPRYVIVPANRKRVDWWFKHWATHVFYMPDGTDYKDRNQIMVNMCEAINAYPNRGELEDPRSGTWQAVRQARTARKSILVNPLSGNQTIWEP